MESSILKRKKKSIIVAISGASGAYYGIYALMHFKKIKIETDLIVSNAAKRTICEETNYDINYIENLATRVHNNKNIGAICASGTFRTIGMIIFPCSAKTLGEIASGIGSSLITRAADVTLKERRKLILMVRETPLNLAHIKNMERVTLMGGIIAPPMPSYYTYPDTIADIIEQTTLKTLDLLKVNTKGIKRWKG